MKTKSILSCLCVALLAVAAVAEKLELMPEVWENRNPLGGDFTNGIYSCLNEAAHSFAVSKTVPLSSNAVASVTYTPVEIVGSTFKTAAVALYESPSRYWHLALVETPVGRRDFELCEMRDGQWLSHKDLKLVVDTTKGTWKLGEPLRLSIAMDGKGVEGTVHAADGRLIFRRRFAFPGGSQLAATASPANTGGSQLAATASGAINCAPPVVACGRPALKCYGISGVYSDAEATHGEALPERVEKTSVNAQTNASHTAFYRTTRDADGRWWFVDPEGKPFFLAGAGTVNSSGDYNAELGYAPYGRTVARKYPSVNDWATNTLARLVSWGFNMIVTTEKSVIRRRLPHTMILGIGTEMSSRGDYEILPCDGGPCTAFPNVFSPKFEAYCRYVAKNRCAPNKDDPWLIGYYIDNELAWWGDARKFRAPPSRGLFDACAKKPAGHSARIALEKFLKERGIASPEAASEEVTREFIRLIARRYFEITSRAIREADPNHLVLGCRFAGLRSSDPVVWEECGRYCDVVSVNIYPMVDLDRGIALNGLHAKAQPIADVIAERAVMANKPVIVTEWSFTALDSGLPCMHGAGQRFFTQRERAEATSIFARTLYALPCCAGYVYFKWSDQPAYGRKSEKSENSNYGLVDANDDPWPEQVAALAAIQNDPMKWRYAPLPQEKPIVRPSAEAAARNCIDISDTCDQLTFVNNPQGSFVLSNNLIRLAGRIGGNGVAVGATGIFSPSIREFSGGKMWWSGASEVVDARGEVKDGVGILDVTFRGTTKAGAFEVSERFYLPSGQPFFFAELRTIANKGARALPVDTAFFRLVPKERAGVKVAKGDDALAPPKDGQPTPIPPCLWRPWRTGAWELPDGSYLGLTTPRLTGVDIRFWQDKNLHPDASFTFSRVELAPGGTFDVSGCPFVVGACSRDGLSSWSTICARVRVVRE